MSAAGTTRACKLLAACLWPREFLHSDVERIRSALTPRQDMIIDTIYTRGQGYQYLADGFLVGAPKAQELLTRALLTLYRLILRELADATNPNP